MSKLEELINRDLLVNKKEKRMITVNVEEEQIKQLDKIARQFSAINNGKNFSRKYLVETAIQAYIEEATKVLKNKFNINISDSIEKPTNKEQDLVIYPGNLDGFEECFLGENEWKYVRMKEEKKKHIKYIAIYVTAPVQGITHYGKVKEIIYDGSERKNIIVLDGKPIKLDRVITRGELDPNALRSPRYVNFSDLKNINTLDEIL